MEQVSQPTTTTVIVKQKSVGLAFLLAFLFGPLGLLYASIIGGVVMFFAGLLFFFILPLIGPILCWIVCIVWAIVASQNGNKITTIRS
jgi:hypothetical protein